MKTIGLIGGMSWESSAEYYRIINETVKEKLGGLHSARCIMYSVDFEEVEKLQHEGKWREATELMIDAAKRIERGGAKGIILGCTEIPLLIKQENSSVPLFDTTKIHAQAAVELALKTENSILNGGANI